MAGTQVPPSASAMALREAFGDRKPPDISRKITACVACRKLKIRCHMDGGHAPCSRCRKRGLSCTVNRSLQQVLESDISWKDIIEQRLRGYENALTKIADKVGCPEVLSFVHEPQPDTEEAGAAHTLSRMSASISPAQLLDQQPQTWAVVNDPRSGPAAIPASVVSEVSPGTTFSQVQNGQDTPNDLISQGVLQFHQAEKLFRAYHARMDNFLYTILPEHESLSQVRKSSSLLTAAICAVGALHVDPDVFPQCHRHFASEASAHMFSQRHSLDDLRGLCVGAFWLHDMSWALVGADVRIATEMNIHKTVVKLNPESKDWYLQARLYCLVYICDHHFSIVYGRVSQALLQCAFASEDDARLLSQVEIWSISTQVYDTFSIDTDRPIPDSQLPHLRRFGIALDSWHADWIDRFAVNKHVGNYPQKGVGLHFHFAKLFLCSHAFRGAWHQNSAHYDLLPELAKSANLAVKSATSILRVIVDDTEIQSHLNGVPAYFDTMIAFAVVFLIKLTTKESPAVRVDRVAIFALLDALSGVLEATTATMSKHHLLSSIASSIRNVVEKGRPPIVMQSGQRTVNAFDPPAQDLNWMADPDATGFINNFDFLNPPNSDVDFNFMYLDTS